MNKIISTDNYDIGFIKVWGSWFNSPAGTGKMQSLQDFARSFGEFCCGGNMCKKPWIDESCLCHGETLFCDECGNHLVEISKDVLRGEIKFQCEEGHRTVLTVIDKTQVKSLAA